MSAGVIASSFVASAGLDDLLVRDTSVSTTDTWTTLPLPAGTQVGDLVAVAITDRWYYGSITNSDSRFTTIFSTHAVDGTSALFAIGIATDLSDVAINASWVGEAVLVAYQGGGTVLASADVGSPGTLPTRAAKVGLLAGFTTTQSVPYPTGLTNYFTVPSGDGWVNDVFASNSFVGTAIWRYVGTNPTPASNVSASGSSYNRFVVAGL